jgi:hypothetical protein
VTFHRKIFL